MKQYVIGAGQIGRAIAEVLGPDTLLGDVGAEPVPVDVLHVCFPWTRNFDHAVRAYQHVFRPSLTVIHSTVPVGTSRRLHAVHSPVTGRHPRLAESVRTFRKWFGGSRAAEAADLFAAVGVQTETTPDAETTEAGKLWQTLQFGLLVAMEKESRRFATEWHADPDVVYREMNRDYNDGYAALGEPWRLPILDHMPGGIGGHCVIPNARITPTTLADALLMLDREWQRWEE